MKASMSLLISGRSGRMGREIEALASEFGLHVVGGLGSASGPLESWLKKNTKPDVVIDFSLPTATVDLARACAENNIPLVSGVTGLSEAEKQALEHAARSIPVLYSANMSVGIQMMMKALDALSGATGFDISIEEVHHRDKKDRPSGTALLLNDELKRISGHGAAEIVSLRGGGGFGTHRVLALSDSESLTFEHTALNRAVFARGACRAARWIIGQAPGLYSLRDTLV